jgi:hypothetical protein
MFIMHRMAAWLEKHPTKKNDPHAKKVCFVVNINYFAVVAVNHEYIFLTRIASKSRTLRGMGDPHGG